MWNTNLEREEWALQVYNPFSFPARARQQEGIERIVKKLDHGQSLHIASLYTMKPHDNDKTLEGSYRALLARKAKDGASELLIHVSNMGTKAWLSAEIQEVLMATMAQRANFVTIPAMAEFTQGGSSEVITQKNGSDLLVARVYTGAYSRPLYAQEQDLATLGRAIGEWDVLLRNSESGKSLVKNLSVFDAPLKEYRGAEHIIDYPEDLNRATGDIPDNLFNTIRAAANHYLQRSIRRKKLFETAALNITMETIGISHDGKKVVVSRPDQVMAAPAKTMLGLAAAHIVPMAADAPKAVRHMPTPDYAKAFWLATGYNEVVPLGNRVDEHDLPYLAIQAICFTEIFGKMGHIAEVKGLRKTRTRFPSLRASCEKIAYVQKFYKAAFGG